MSTEVNKYTNKIVYTVNVDEKVIEEHDYHNLVTENGDETTTPFGIAPRLHVRENEEEGIWEIWSWGAGGNNPRLCGFGGLTEEEANEKLFELAEEYFFNSDNAPHPYDTEEEAQAFLNEWIEENE